VSRELEIVSNLPSQDGKSFRTRIKAIEGYDNESPENIINHAKSSIDKMARFGFFLQDKYDDIINNIIGKLNETGKFASIGTEMYKDGNKYATGSGKQRNLQLTFGGPIHKALRAWRFRQWVFDEDIRDSFKECRLKESFLIRIKNEVTKERFHNIANLFSYWEWRNNTSFSLTSVSTTASDWTFHDIPALIKNKFPEHYLDFDDDKIKREAAKFTEISCLQDDIPNPYDFNQSMFNHIIK